MKCNMNEKCAEPVTHIDEKGFIYCAQHGKQRSIYGRRCRKMRAWELKLIREGKPLPSYEPISLKKAQEVMKRRAMIRCARCGQCRLDIVEPDTGDLCGCAFMLDEVTVH